MLTAPFGICIWENRFLFAVDSYMFITIINKAGLPVLNSQEAPVTPRRKAHFYAALLSVKAKAPGRPGAFLIPLDSQP
jgi:hypothetical protein